MVTVAAPQSEINEGPERITIENVQFWCKHAKELKQTQAHKAHQFVEYDSIHYVGDDPEFSSKYTFVCLPLNTESEFYLEGYNGRILEIAKKPYPVNYNNSVYKIFKNEGGRFECNCQGWQTREKRGEGGRDGCSCSHVLALFFCFKMRKFGNHVEGPED